MTPLSFPSPPPFISLQLGEGVGAKETPQQRYQRLQHEVQELVREVEQIQVSTTPAVWDLRADRPRGLTLLPVPPLHRAR